jgi:hypothetical protein
MYQNEKSFCAPLRLRLILLALIAGSFTRLLAQEQAEPSPVEPPLCELKIEGSHIERLVMTQKYHNDPNDQRNITFEKPGESVQLPAGQYHVSEIHLRGGYKCGIPIIESISGSGTEQYGWFSLSPDNPYSLRVGNCLKPDLMVFRTGQFLRLRYSLSDVEGRTYANNECKILPNFTVLLEGKPIGSGIIGRYG